VLKCSHDNLQDEHTMLQVSHEVVVTSVRHLRPLTQKCTCSLNSINFVCANACCSQSQQSSVERIHVDSCDDLVAEENDLLKLEVKRLELEMIKLQGKALGQPTQDNRDHMMNKLELGTTISRSFSQGKYKSPHHKRQEKVKKDLKHINCFKCSDMGHYAFMCSAQVESKTRLSRRKMSYPVFMPKPCTHHMHDPGSIVQHIRRKVFTANQMSRIEYNYYINSVSKDYDDSQRNGTVEDSITPQE
jgi:hypothetical protein